MEAEQVAYNILHDFIALIYPRNCVSCGNSLYHHEDQICLYCSVHLPKTQFHLEVRNPVEQLFYGRVQINMASSYYLFNKKGDVQKILHAIKYKGNKELANLIGKYYASDLKNISALRSADVIVPVPLHEKKLKQRGYNQSEEFARGIAKELNLELNPTLLKRKEDNSTQTKKNKYERWENVNDIFEVDQNQIGDYKHLVLVDDVVTTGATIEACIQALQKCGDIKISVLTMAYAVL